MELPGATYLVGMATISITYGGFGVLVTVFRQMSGGALTSFDIFFVRSILTRSFLIAGLSMLPLMLAMFDLSQNVIWRASSLIAAILEAIFILSWPSARRKYTDAPVPTATIANHVFALTASLFLLFNAVGIFKMHAGVFGAGIGAYMLSAIISYMIAPWIMLKQKM
jgi:hypothetical protein